MVEARNALSNGQSEKNMVQQNKKDAPRFPRIKEQEAAWSCFLRDRNIDQAVKRKADLAFEHRNSAITDCQRWHDFRLRRKEAVDQFIEAKARQIRIRWFLTYLKAIYPLHQFAAQYEKFKTKRIR